MKIFSLSLVVLTASMAAATPLGCSPGYASSSKYGSESPPVVSPSRASPPVSESPPMVAESPPPPPVTTPKPPPPPTTTSSKLTSVGAIKFVATAYAVAPKPGGKNTDGTQGEILGGVNACGQALWISNSGPCTYCPTVVTDCPKANVTAFDVSGGASLDVEVPGGQQMYLAPDKHVGFTQAHSIFIPTNSTVSGFKSLAVEGETQGYFVFDDVEWIGCPPNLTQFPGSLPATLRLFAQVEGITDEDVGGKLSDCRTVQLRTTPFPNGQVGAWQYT